MIAILERDTVPCLPPVIEAPTLKRCSCGAEYTREQWAALDYVGAQVDDVEALELRTCSACRSTMAIEVTS